MSNDPTRAAEIADRPECTIGNVHPLRNALNRIADLGTCANGRTPAYKLFQQAIDIAVEALAAEGGARP